LTGEKVCATLLQYYSAFYVGENKRVSRGKEDREYEGKRKRGRKREKGRVV
jgi:hypothetical protein